MMLNPIYCYAILTILLISLHIIICKIENKVFIRIVQNMNNCHVEKFAEDYLIQAKILYIISIFLFYLSYISVSVFFQIQKISNNFLIITLLLSVIPILIEKGNLKLINHLFTLKFYKKNLSDDMIEVTYVLGEIIVKNSDLYFCYLPTKNAIKMII